jgi:small subunit ribosomal protein S16
VNPSSRFASTPRFRRYLDVVTCAAGRICPAVVVQGRVPRKGRSLNRPREHNPIFQHFERNLNAVVMIRLARVGARKQPYYRIVVIEKDRARNGRSIEVVGTYNPRTTPATVDLKHERITYWRSKGATLSPTLEKLVTKNPAVAPTPEPAPSPAPVTPTETVSDPAAA